MKKEFYVDQLHVLAFDTRVEMAEYAALRAKEEIISMLRSKTNLNIIFAAAPSQDEDYPATILRTHQSAKLFLDNESSSMVRNNLEEKLLTK